MALLCDSQHFSLVFRLEGQEEQSARKSAASEKKRNYVKKPLNAFMLFMKEMRPKVIAECTLRESSAINQILGRKVSPFLTAVQLWAWDTPVVAKQGVWQPCPFYRRFPINYQYNVCIRLGAQLSL